MPGCLDFVRYWAVCSCIAIVRERGCDVINFEINLIFAIKRFFYMSKKSRQKSKYLKGLVTHNDILKIYTTITIKNIFLEYFEIIFEIF